MPLPYEPDTNQTRIGHDLDINRTPSGRLPDTALTEDEHFGSRTNRTRIGHEVDTKWTSTGHKLDINRTPP